MLMLLLTRCSDSLQMVMLKIAAIFEDEALLPQSVGELLNSSLAMVKLGNDATAQTNWETIRNPIML